mmetsp:Transcript_23595/g.47846  ORF Transcript_23595/g.47846 Transcript_23595/m.47846 type:complete len:561 (-) Transcript_23595:292-1974(-)|eukprot:CAMPEP_0183297390 /NCGR_PEP_ID=MMETSP0160_2-20130417/4695_1 /TAXON_ID=2839 ORGANISM="Odontella Sinensis, Strain Grunow 1884" /NCGR_SAMPLE_ID=MMETSP0160_2 /ASSEMBLY_ACC=CAM_ASM_000250 /LENGTH=560 /DNA_ID=CAMNT_0025459205 /DNA_START=51 /DNA_END=1733 /DNA_ORIENTATION=+
MAELGLAHPQVDPMMVIMSAVQAVTVSIVMYLVYAIKKDVIKSTVLSSAEKNVGEAPRAEAETRSIRGTNVYGPYKKNTMTPWANHRNEGREGDPVDKSQAKHWMNLPPDVRDKGTPDQWIPRDGRMVRLTGRHPFNSEPPVSELAKEGFFTPPNLHIIRNHGAVPKLGWDTHKLLVGGPFAPKKLELSMNELTQGFPKTEFPVSISCCGNRRKELNMVKQTIGFNWGIGAMGTCIYEGVLVRDLLLRAGVDPNNTAGKHVEFISSDYLPNKAGNPGPFPEEPWGDQVHYGTSIPLSKAMSLSDEVMVAFACNGERLHPDRGFPIRLVIPGYIGGRMIKWLGQINVLDHETYSCYHYWDNKYLPPQITAEVAARDGWWYKQEYIINELSLNSVITYPNHNDTLPIKEYIDKKVVLKGYAHAGGGRPVTRVEVSTDCGETWELAEIHRTEKPNPYGKHWCWIWWSLPVDAAKLQEEIIVRAWDTSNNPQPDNLTWTLMGQSSNHFFRVKVRIDEDGLGQPVYRFEHPTQPGQQTGGWATRPVDKFKSAGYGKIKSLSDGKV